MLSSHYLLFIKYRCICWIIYMLLFLIIIIVIWFDYYFLFTIFKKKYIKDEPNFGKNIYHQKMLCYVLKKKKHNLVEIFIIIWNRYNFHARVLLILLCYEFLIDWQMIAQYIRCMKSLEIIDKRLPVWFVLFKMYSLITVKSGCNITLDYSLQLKILLLTRKLNQFHDNLFFKWFTLFILASLFLSI